VQPVVQASDHALGLVKAFVATTLVIDGAAL
jgi:hypothetical protein